LQEGDNPGRVLFYIGPDGGDGKDDDDDEDDDKDGDNDNNNNNSNLFTKIK
jgi:hypothetical protein